jgi:flagellar biosynthesis/type III secretory pathway protein FliH
MLNFSEDEMRRAYDRGYQDGLEKGGKEGYERGFQDGLKQGILDFEAAHSREVEEVKDVSTAL